MISPRHWLQNKFNSKSLLEIAKQAVEMAIEKDEQEAEKWINSELKNMDKHLIFRAVSYIPRGKVLTYGAAARLAGVKSPRLIGKILHQNINPKKIPCHRVVNAKGGLALNYAFGGEAEQRRKLELEGINFIRQKVDLNKHLWKPHRLLGLFFQYFFAANIPQNIGLYQDYHALIVTWGKER